MNEEQKGIVECKVFIEFLEMSQMPIEPKSVQKEFPPFPDISCNLMGKGKVWFELTEACSPEFKRTVNELGNVIHKTKLSDERLNNPSIVFGGDVSDKTLRKKIAKKYPVESVELLIYTNGMTEMTDEILIKHFKPILSKGAGQFQKVWLMGEDVHQVWPSQS
jgi:hypothetical protein